jgi:SAM-dependent methyltransferase
MVTNCGALETRGERNMADQPPEARRFRSAARHYLPGRQPYASRLIRRVADLVGLGPEARVLDLGCGPGMLAGAFAPFALAVVAMDPEPEMLRIAERVFAARNITYRQGGSEELPGDLGHFRLVTMGRSFHWMDRAETLRRLDRMLVPGGAVALFDARSATGPAGTWGERYAALVRSYAGSDEERPHRRSPEWLGHEFVLVDSPFSSVEAISVFEPHEVSAAMLIDRAFSRSSSAPERVGAAAEGLVRDIEALVAAVAPDGRLHELVVSTALIARRPEDIDA